jgi:signal transduction histidine kinase
VRAARYVLTDGVSALAGAITAVGLVVALPFRRGVLPHVRLLASAERRRIGRLTGVAVAEPCAPGWAASPREVAWLALHAVVGPALAACRLALGLVLIAGVLTPLVWWALPAGERISYVVPVTTWFRALALPLPPAAVAAVTLRWGVPPAAKAVAELYRVLLRPPAADVLARRVAEVTATRADALEAHAAELRRIERELHDGAQARLVSVAIQLGVAQRRRQADPEGAERLVDNARGGIEQALADLRGVVRTVYPPILADRGLAGALDALAAACPVPLSVRVEPLGRLPAAVEGAAYFIVAEALTNTARHSGATHAELRVSRHDDQLSLQVSDNGAGGADPHGDSGTTGGTGLAGIRRRAAALDGWSEVVSPAGGPTVVRAELPCG